MRVIREGFLVDVQTIDLSTVHGTIILVLGPLLRRFPCEPSELAKVEWETTIRCLWDIRKAVE